MHKGGVIPLGIWDSYKSKVKASGGNIHDAGHLRESRYIYRKLPNNLSYHTVTIYPHDYGYNITTDEIIEHSFSQNVAILNSDNYEEKTLITMPGEDVALGDLIYWMDNHWLVTERDANTTLYTKMKLLQCNHLLHWIVDGEIMEQWSVVEDGTKLKCVPAHDSLAYWKRYVKTIPLIAGTPLELYKPQRTDEIYRIVMVKELYRLGNRQPSPYRGRFNDYSRRRSRFKYRNGEP